MQASVSEYTRAQEILSYAFRERIASRIAKEHGVSPAKAAAMFDSAIGFLEMCAQYPDEHFSPTKPVDIAWHEFILYTREYADFCDRLAGRFIHHEVCDETHRPPNEDPKFTVNFMRKHRIDFDPDMWKPDLANALCYDTNCNN